MDSFNQLKLIDYINLTYDLLIKNKEDKSFSKIFDQLIKTRTILCAAHFLKSFIKKVKLTDKDKTRTLFFIYSFKYLFSASYY